MSILKNILSKKPKFDKNKNVFFVFLILSALIWFLTNLSKEYTNTAVFSIKYVNVPKSKLLHEHPTQEVPVLLKAQGFSLLRYKLTKKQIAIDLGSVRKKSGSTYFYLPNEHLIEFESQIASKVQVSKILKDTIFIGLANKITKKVPIIPHLNISYKLGYNLSNTIKIVPDSIVIVGVKNAIDTIRFIETITLDLKDVDKALQHQIELKLPKIPAVSYSNENVLLTGNVEKFTEGKFNIPFKIVSLPRGYKINTFPKEVTIKYQVALSHFNKILPSSFNVVCDYKETVANNVSYLIPKIIDAPLIVSEVKLTPKKIEFLIVK